MQIRHSTGNVQRKSYRLGRIHHNSGSTMQQIVQRTPRHILTDDDQPRGSIARSYNWKNVRMGEDAQLGELLVEVPTDACIAFAYGQNFRHDVVVLPSTAPSLATGSDGQLGVQHQVLDVDSLVPGKSGVARSRLQTQPALVLETDLLQLLPTFDCQVVQTMVKK